MNIICSNQKKFSLLSIAFIVSFFFLLYSFNLPGSYIFNTDIARDSYGILEIAQGKLTLIGPSLDFGGYFAGPYYYLMFAPILRFTHYDFQSIILFNAFVYALCLSFFFLIVKKNYSLTWALLVTLLIGLFPIYLIGARNPGNAYTFIPLLFFLLISVYFSNFEGKIKLFLLGLLAGIIVNFHLLNILVIFTLLIYIYINLKKKHLLFFFLLGIFASFLPLIVFELRHNFVILKRTIYDFQTSNLIRIKENPKHSLIYNLIKSSRTISVYLTFHPIFYLFLFIIPIFFKKFLNKKSFLFCICAATSFIIFTIMSNGILMPHHVFPVSIFLFFALLMFLLTYNIKAIAIILIIGELINFNFALYKPSVRPYVKFENAVKYVIDNNLVNKNRPFNVISIINPQVNVPVGAEYRYFFRKNGYIPNTVNEYDTSKDLFIFSEIGDFNIDSLINWETGQFGYTYLKNRQTFRAGDIWIYKIEKN